MEVENGLAGKRDDSKGPLPRDQRTQHQSRDSLESEVTELYRSTAGRLLGYAMIVAGNASLAQEAVQEAFLRYYAQGVKDKLPAGGHRWLFRVTRNYILDHHKSSSARTSVGLEHALACGDERHQSPDALLERSEAIARALRVLSPREVECLQLRSDGFTYQEIADILGIETGTVASLLARAGKKIRQEFSQREVCEGHGTTS